MSSGNLMARFVDSGIPCPLRLSGSSLDSWGTRQLMLEVAVPCIAHRRALRTRHLASAGVATCAHSMFFVKIGRVDLLERDVLESSRTAVHEAPCSNPLL